MKELKRIAFANWRAYTSFKSYHGGIEMRIIDCEACSFPAFNCTVEELKCFHVERKIFAYFSFNRTMAESKLINGAN